MAADNTEASRCPRCGSAEGQSNYGYNRSGTGRRRCGACGKTYTVGAKNRAYSTEIREKAIALHNSGVSCRGVGRILKMSKGNVKNWTKGG
jgi:transposase-like protein